MSRLCSQLELAQRFLFVTIALSGIVFGQVEVVSSSSAKDIFSAIQENLTDVADRTLAAALANQTWIKASNPAAPGGKPSSSNEENSILQIRAAFDRVNQLRPTLEPILRAEGVPVDLSAIVLVESGGMSTVLSPKGARGVWQFMPDTARRYGLVIDGVRDERVDVIKSTRAAARYLRDLYANFGDWFLALAAYNAGELAVSNAISRVPSRDFESVRESGRLPLETRRYVAAISAAINRLHDGTSWLAPRGSKRTQVVYASSGSGD